MISFSDHIFDHLRNWSTWKQERRRARFDNFCVPERSKRSRNVYKIVKFSIGVVEPQVHVLSLKPKICKSCTNSYGFFFLLLCKSILLHKNIFNTYTFANVGNRFKIQCSLTAMTDVTRFVGFHILKINVLKSCPTYSLYVINSLNPC